MRYFLTLTAFLFSLVISPAFAADAAKDDAKARAYVEKVVQDAMDTIKQSQDGKITDAQAKQKFRGILQESFDIPTIARFTLGRYWRVATDAEKTEFTHLLQTVILNKYADRLLESSGNTYTMKGSKAINERDHGVSMTFQPSGSAPVAFSWRLRKVGNSFKVIDIGVEGVSMSVTHRSDFANVIERNGGKVQALINALKDKKSPLLKS